MGSVIVKKITQRYNAGKVIAVDDVSFEVAAGELFGLIGPDGAGKTSLFRILTTLMLAESGMAMVDGLNVEKDYKEIRNRIGYMPGKFSLYQDLTVEENLSFFATLFDTSIEENFELVREIYVQIEPFKQRRAGKLSGGMKQKLALCCALIHKPKVLFLDEPTTGVDSVSRKEFWEMLKRLKARGITILVSTPYMDEAVLCDRIALMQEGRILSIDTPARITQQFPHRLFAVKTGTPEQLLRDLRSFVNTRSCNAFGENVHVTFLDEAAGSEQKLRAHLEALGHSRIEVLQVNPTVEDCFIELMVTSKKDQPAA